MSVGRILTLGFGTFAGVKFLPTLGYLSSGGPPPPTVVPFNGMSTADGLTYFHTVRRPVIVLPDTTRRTGISGDLNPDSLSKETYLIDGELP